jgi:hypothetical protein
MEGLDYVTALFYGVAKSKEFIQNKDVAKEMKVQFEGKNTDAFFEEIHAEISRIDKLYDEDISEIEGDDSLNDEKKSQKIQAMHQEMSEACIGLGVLTREFIEYKTKK